MVSMPFDYTVFFVGPTIALFRVRTVRTNFGTCTYMFGLQELTDMVNEARQKRDMAAQRPAQSSIAAVTASLEGLSAERHLQLKYSRLITQ